MVTVFLPVQLGGKEPVLVMVFPNPEQTFIKSSILQLKIFSNQKCQGLMRFLNTLLKNLGGKKELKKKIFFVSKLVKLF